jgi:hypothetical protein
MKKIIWTILLFSVTIQIFAGDNNNSINRDSLARDFAYLSKLLETSHPDPYSSFGGRVFFNVESKKTEMAIRKSCSSIDEFALTVENFLSKLHDGHTFLNYHFQRVANSGKIPFGLKIIPDGAIINALPTAESNLLGSKVERINGISVDSLLNAVNNIYPCENIYGEYGNLEFMFNYDNFTALSRILPYTNKFDLELLTPNGEHKSISLMPLEKNTELAQFPDDDKLSSLKNLQYGFIDERKNVMMLKLTNILARENFEYTLQNHWPGAMQQLKSFYKNVLQSEMPADSAKALENVPSFSEIFLAMLKEMRMNGSKNLIIDLRGDEGGWTPITLPALYMMYGDRYLTTDMGTSDHVLLSDLYLKKMNMTLQEFNHENQSNYNIGELISYEDKSNANLPIDSLRSQFISSSMCGMRKALESMHGKPIYTPAKVYVVTDEWTFSAAFHFAFFLWKMGATVVGVPSSQAPNTFMEQTPFQLPYSKITGSISNTMQVFLPATDRHAKVFYPDWIPSYKDYKKYGFNQQSELFYLLDKMK